MTRITSCLCALILATAACNRRDPDVDKLQQQVDDLTEQLAALEQQLAEQSKLRRPPEAPSPDPPIMPADTAIDPSVPQECAGYIAAVTSYAACDKVPPAAREAAKKAIEQMRASWRVNMPEDARNAAGAACATAAEALRNGAQAVGCTILVEKNP